MSATIDDIGFARAGYFRPNTSIGGISLPTQFAAAELSSRRLAVKNAVNAIQHYALMAHFSFAESVKKTAVIGATSLSGRLREKINELAALESNWDGEQAKPIKPHVLADVVETIRRLSQEGMPFHEPFLAPTFDGFVQLEWREGFRSLDFEAVEQGWVAVGTSVSMGSQVYYTAEFERNNFSKLLEFYRWLFADELIWPSL